MIFSEVDQWPLKLTPTALPRASVSSPVQQVNGLLASEAPEKTVFEHLYAPQ